jgi:Polyketide cyclase / dehydrase and lipid transport
MRRKTVKFSRTARFQQELSTMIDARQGGSARAVHPPGRLACAAALIGAAVIAQLLPRGAAAEVTDVAGGGFGIVEQVHVAAAPAAVYALLITPARWWDSQHSFSGSAANLTLDAKAGGCWCETLANGGSVLHLTVVQVMPGKSLRLRGALGPLQGMAVEGAMTFSVQGSGTGTDLKVTYVVGGYAKDGFEGLSKAVDRVLGEQVARLKKLAETGTADKPG